MYTLFTAATLASLLVAPGIAAPISNVQADLNLLERRGTPGMDSYYPPEGQTDPYAHVQSPHSLSPVQRTENWDVPQTGGGQPHPSDPHHHSPQRTVSMGITGGYGGQPQLDQHYPQHQTLRRTDSMGLPGGIGGYGQQTGDHHHQHHQSQFQAGGAGGFAPPGGHWDSQHPGPHHPHHSSERIRSVGAPGGFGAYGQGQLGEHQHHQHQPHAGGVGNVPGAFGQQRHQEHDPFHGAHGQHGGSQFPDHRNAVHAGVSHHGLAGDLMGPPHPQQPLHPQHHPSLHPSGLHAGAAHHQIAGDLATPFSHMPPHLANVQHPQGQSLQTLQAHAQHPHDQHPHAQHPHAQHPHAQQPRSMFRRSLADLD